MDQGVRKRSVLVCMCVCVCVCVCVFLWVSKRAWESKREKCVVFVFMRVCVRAYSLCVCTRTREIRDWGREDNKWCVHARMMLVKSNIYRELTAQVKGAAKLMVTVVAIQDLEAGDVLRRFKAEAAQDEPRHGNDINRCIGTCISLRMIFFSLWFFSIFSTKAWHKTNISTDTKITSQRKNTTTYTHTHTHTQCTLHPICSVLAFFPVWAQSRYR